MRLIFGIFPLLVIPVILYNLIALAGGSVETTGAAGELIQSVQAPISGLLAERFLALPMISGVEWVLTTGDAIVYSDASSAASPSSGPPAAISDEVEGPRWCV
jgi:hypothetical protein